MNPLAFDTETALIRPALLAPPMVCLTWRRPGLEPGIVHVRDALPRIRAWLLDPETLLVGHFAAYDMAVICAQFPELIPLVFAAYKANRVTCTKIRQQLLDIAGGVFRGRIGEKGKWIVHKYELADLSKRHRGVTMIKDGWRKMYEHFLDVPLEQWNARAVEVQAWARARLAEVPADSDEVTDLRAVIADVPEGATRYPLEDATATLEGFLSQEQHAEYLKDQYRQSRRQFVLYLSSVWGLRTNLAGVEALQAELEEARGEFEEELQGLGLVREDGTRDMKKVKALMIETCREYGLPLRRTDAHFKPGAKCGGADDCAEHVCLDSDACEAVVAAAQEEGDSAFSSYAEFVTLGKMLNNDCKMLRAGTVYPVHTRYDLAETGRTTSSKPNIQNLNTGRIKNKKSTAQRLRPGIRQAFVPRPGKVFAQADFPQLELYTLAQTCISWLGWSKLGEALNAGLDPHLLLAARILGISYEEAAANKKREDVDHARQIGKVFNFGKPGGMGNKKLQVWARKTYGVDLTIEQLDAFTAQWKEEFPEMAEHFARVNAMFGDEVERASVETLFTERVRGGATYCAACNNGFQALGADCASEALWLVAEAEYVGRRADGSISPLFNSRTVAFVHDEIIAETDDGPGAHDAAFELARLMVEGANKYLPNVPIPMSKMEPTLMRRWDKNAKQVFEGGRLIPWG